MGQTRLLRWTGLTNLVRIGVLKIGCLGIGLVAEYIIDERAKREDIEVFVVGTGSKMSIGQCLNAATELEKQRLDIVLIISPNPGGEGPRPAIERIGKSGVPTIILTNAASRKVTKEFESEGFGYLILEADAMIGAKREFLDANEAALFNGDVLKVLAITGAINVVVDALDKVIESVKRTESPELPRIYVDLESAMTMSGLRNEYAKSKAMAAHEIARRVATFSYEGCFVEKDWTKYVPIVASCHEMMRAASKLADEAREIEKGADTVFRQPHAKDGTRLKKSQLMEKPTD